MSIVKVLFVVCCAVSVSATEFYSTDGVYDGEKKGVKSVSLFCSFNMTSDNVSVEWYKNGQPLLSNTTYSINSSVAGVSNLTINHINDMDDLGPLYSCIFRPNGTKLDLTLYGVPTVVIDRHGEKSKTLIEGDHLELSCTVSGWPLPSIMWRHENNILDLTGMQNLTRMGNVSSSLLLNVDGVNVADRGNFVCNATNSVLGLNFMRSDSILVRVKGRLAPLWPFLGIVAELITLAIIIGVYEFRQAKQKGLKQQKIGNEHPTLAPKTSQDSAVVRLRK